MSTLFHIPRLEFHAAHGCNLACESCSHWSNQGLTGLLTPQETETQISAWRTRLQPHTFAILGGEPTLNPHLIEIVEIAVAYCPRIEVTTNAHLLARHPTLGAALSKARMQGVLRISIHEPYPPPTTALALADRWRVEHGIAVRFARAPWTRRYHGTGTTLRPYNDGDFAASFRICPARNCPQLYAGRIWKCAQLAYLPMTAAKFPQIAEHFAVGLTYEPLAPNATDAELNTFFTRKAEPACGLCPAKHEHFTPA